MITVAQRKKLKKVFKNGYVKDVQTLLNDSKILNKKGEPFGDAYVRHVFNGINSNDQIEDQIFKLYQKRVNEQSKKTIVRKEILENKKPEAGTSGAE
jgi:hypothetical protein